MESQPAGEEEGEVTSLYIQHWHDLQKKTLHNDIVYTPAGLAKRCIDLIPFEDNDLVLDPARGKGAFYDNFPDMVRKTWCEYDDGRDFMMFNEAVDWTVTNPPYSALNRWLEKACIGINPGRTNK